MNKRGKSILLYSLLIAGIIICGLLLAGAASLYNKGDSDLNINYRLVTEDLYGRQYTPDCFVDCHLTYCVSYFGNAAPSSTSLSKQDLGQDFLFLDNSDSSILKGYGVDYLTTETYEVDIPEYGTCEGSRDIYDNKTGEVIDTEKYSYECQTGSHKESRTRQVWKALDSSSQIDTSKEKDVCFDIWGKLQPGLNQKFSVDVIPKLKLQNKEFAMSEMAEWNQVSCGYRRTLNVTENNGTALVQYPVNASITATSNLNNPNETRVLVNNEYETDFRWNSTSFTTGNSYILFWETNVSASSTGTDYLYYGCLGLTDAQKNVTSYSNPDTNTILYFTFDEGSGATGTTIVDKSSYGNNGVVNGTLSSSSGKYNGRALTFDGNESNYTRIPFDASLNVGTGNFTLEAWINATGDNSVIFASSDNGPDNWHYLFFWILGHKIRCQMRDLSGVDVAASSATSVDDSKWHHVTCMKTGNTLSVYVDGNIDGSDTGCANINPDNGYEKTVGTRRLYYSSYPFKGTIEEFRFSNYARDMTTLVPKVPEPTVIVGGEENTSSYANEADGDTAIQEGINQSVIGTGAEQEEGKQLYVTYLNSSQMKGKFDYVAVSGNQRWAFNYITPGDPTSSSKTNMLDLTPVLYVWETDELKNKSQITAEVKSFIDGTYQSGV